ncbi:MAG: hypothetical protein KBD78_11860 [Oligoflexales bacterium]|nr:hypothetical protein [Oligoflexales bacterium]
MKIFLFIAFLNFLISCSGNSSKNGNLPRFNNLAFNEIDSTNLTVTESAILGSGSIGLEQPLGETSSETKIVTSFYLEDEGSITFHTYADKKLENGLDIVFTREGSALETKFVLAGVEKVFAFEHDEEGDIYAGESIDLKFDVHNSESPAHVVFWQATADEDVSTDNLIFNSEDTEEGDNQAPGSGAGTYLGITFDQASMSNLAIAAATEENEIGEAHEHE